MAIFSGYYLGLPIPVEVFSIPNTPACLQIFHPILLWVNQMQFARCWSMSRSRATELRKKLTNGTKNNTVITETRKPPELRGWSNSRLNMTKLERSAGKTMWQSYKKTETQRGPQIQTSKKIKRPGVLDFALLRFFYTHVDG